MKTLKWYEVDCDEWEFRFTRQWDESGITPPCPKCAKPSHEWFGQVDQLSDGSPAYGHNYVCYRCSMETEFEVVDEEN